MDGCQRASEGSTVWEKGGGGVDGMKACQELGTRKCLSVTGPEGSEVTESMFDRRMVCKAHGPGEAFLVNIVLASCVTVTWPLVLDVEKERLSRFAGHA